MGRSGLALLLAAALLPLLMLPGQSRSSRLGGGWLACALAPLLGLVSLAGAFPALAGQSRRWRERAAYGALGYWWLTLASHCCRTACGSASQHPRPPAPPGRARCSSPPTTCWRACSALGMLFGALLWGAAALVLPWIVRGRLAVLDLAAVALWSAALLLAEPAVDAGLSGAVAHPSPRGAALGAVVGGDGRRSPPVRCAALSDAGARSMAHVCPTDLPPVGPAVQR